MNARPPFVSGGSDGCKTHLGYNALFNGDVSLTIGTSGAVKINDGAKPRYDRKQRRCSIIFLPDGIYIAGGP